MFTKLTLDNFKNFQHAELELGSFTVLIGANATGKSNIREAFRFLQGIGRGYTIAEIIGEKYTAGERVWPGMRGGTRELTYISENTSSPTCSLQLLDQYKIFNEIVFADEVLVTTYDIKIATGYPNIIPQVITENLEFDGREIFGAHVYDIDNTTMVETRAIHADGLHNAGARWNNTYAILHQIIPQFAKIFSSIEYPYQPHIETTEIEKTIDFLISMRFFDFVPDTLRKPSFPGQLVLGDNGENLSSVLYAICQNPQQKEILLSWVEDLTPMDAVDFEFPPDQIGRILVTVVERNGQRISAYSMSDGTLRFLAILAAFLGPERAKFYFLEELENGIHPTRLHLLTQFIENQVAQGDIQVIATTHSPLLLNYLKPETLEDASILYRLENQPDAHIKRLVDVPDARQLIKKQSVMRLYESGWFEDALFFMDDEEPMGEAEAVA